MPTYEDTVKRLRRKGMKLPPLLGSRGLPGIPAPAVVKCPHCDRMIPIRIRTLGVRLAVDYPMSEKDVKRRTRGAG